MGLHIGSVFILLGVSMLGSFLPVLLSMYQARWVIVLIRCGTLYTVFVGGVTSRHPPGMSFGYGTILATGFVHMLGASISYFSNPCLTGAWADYSAWGMVFCIIAILFMQIFDFIIETILYRKAKKQGESAKEAELVKEAEKPAPVEQQDAEAGCLEGCTPTGPSQPAQEYIHDVAVKELEIDDHHFLADVRCLLLLMTCGHDPIQQSDNSSKVSIYLVEAGIVMHSILIGLALGVASGSEFTTLLIAISFHQVCIYKCTCDNGDSKALYSFSRALPLVRLQSASASAFGVHCSWV